MISLALEYWLFVFLSAVGVIQLLVVRERLKGLWLFPNPLSAYLCSSLLIASSYGWFFLTENRAKPGLEGAQQAIIFFLAALSALFFTLLLSSIINAHKFSPREKRGSGLKALGEMTYLQAIKKQPRS